jgi:hypothetical protein
LAKREVATQKVAAASRFSHEAYAIEVQGIGEVPDNDSDKKRAEPKLCPFAEA